MHNTELNTTLTGNEGDWTFIGVPKWKQDHEGLIYPPVWSYPDFSPAPGSVPNMYAHELGREDFAFLTSQPLHDTDVSVEYKCPYGSVIHGGLVFRAMDSARFYCVNIVNLHRWGQGYEVTLSRQDASGYQKELARAIAPHSIVPDRIYQVGPRTREEWDHSSADWVTVRVQATGTFIRVSMDGRILFDVRDRAYPVGCVGLFGRGSVYFRNFQAAGRPGALPAPWATHQGELPRFICLNRGLPDGFNAHPTVCHTDDGVTLVTWTHAPRVENPSADIVTVLTRSEDEGKTWSRPEPIFQREGHDCSCGSVFAHRDGTVSCRVAASLLGEDRQSYAATSYYMIRSSDGGKSWSAPEELLIAGESISSIRDRHPNFIPYSRMLRISDGTVLMTAHEYWKLSEEGGVLTPAMSVFRSLLLRSADDGYTWETPIYIDERNTENCECEVAETTPGHLIALMRPLTTPSLWVGTSADGGRSWTQLAQSGIGGTTPYLLRHNSGALLLFSRGCGTWVRLSFDQGKSWPNAFRVSPATSMMGPAEMADGRVLFALNEGYRVPANVRAQCFRVTTDGLAPAE